MKIQLIEGDFKSEEALELISEMVRVKIKYHENKITKTQIEEDIKRRESKIKSLQRDLHELRNEFSALNKNVIINTVINIE